MCTVSMIGDHFSDKWGPRWPGNPFPSNPDSGQTVVISPVSRDEFDALRKDVLEMKELLKRAKKYDEDNGEPDCEMDDKVALLKKVAEAVGVDLSEIFSE